MKKVLCIGEATYDITMILEDWITENKKFGIKEILETGGGSSANSAYLLSSWGIETHFVGIVGDDIYGSIIKKELNSVNVNLDFLKTSKKYPTIKNYILVNSENATRTMLKYKEENLKYDCSDIPSSADYILVDGTEKELSIKEIKDNKNAISILDAANFNESTVLLSRIVDYVIASIDYVESYTNTTLDINNTASITKIYKSISNNINGQLIITLGDNGCLYSESGTIKLLPGLKVNAIDVTGASDVFHGAFVYGLIKGYSFEEIMKFSNIAGALSVQKKGGRTSIPNLKNVQEIYEKIR